MTLSDEAAAVTARLNRFLEGGRVRLLLVQRLVSDSAWWYGHPKGPARAPKHFERVTTGAHGWELEFGANYFLVEAAIRRCTVLISDAIRAVLENGVKVDCVKLREDMRWQVRGAVANFNGEEYGSYYDISKGFMHFGTQAINVNDFVETLCMLAEVHRICR